MRSRDATPADLKAIASWIGSQRECELWAGPDISFPLEPHVLATQIGMPDALNVVLEDGHGLAAFGQALARSPGRAHLARVIVRPDARGRGIGKILVQALLARVQESGPMLVTLNVYRDNAAAISLRRAWLLRRRATAGRPSLDRDVVHAAQHRPPDRRSGGRRAPWATPSFEFEAQH